MAAIVEFDESNGASSAETVTDAITTLYYGSVDQTGLTLAGAPIAVGANSVEKWIRWHLLDLNGSGNISNCRFYADAALTSTTDGHYFNGDLTSSGYTVSRKTAYATPVATSTSAVNVVPTADPGVANIGIGGSLTGILTGAGRSDYCVSQIRVGGGSAGGDSILELFLAYDDSA